MTYLTQFGGDKLTTMLPSFYYNLQTIPANFILFANNQPTPSYHIIVYHSIIFFIIALTAILQGNCLRFIHCSIQFGLNLGIFI